MASNKPGFYRSEVGYHSPTSSQNMGSKKAQYLPIMAKSSYYRPKINLKSKNIIIKPTYPKIYGLSPIDLARALKTWAYAFMWPSANPLGAARWPLLHKTRSHGVK
jgi:hypothetical protein